MLSSPDNRMADVGRTEGSMYCSQNKVIVASKPLFINYLEKHTKVKLKFRVNNSA